MKILLKQKLKIKCMEYSTPANSRNEQNVYYFMLGEYFPE